MNVGVTYCWEPCTAGKQTVGRTQRQRGRWGERKEHGARELKRDRVTSAAMVDKRLEIRKR